MSDVVKVIVGALKAREIDEVDRPPRFQAFNYNGVLVIRDVRKPPGEQEVWRGDDRAAMMDALVDLEAEVDARAIIEALTTAGLEIKARG